ncbi:MAG TPA: PKD domain-containing protein [Acidobacteriaceae bacterium]|jgi:streptogramin lyase
MRWGLAVMACGLIMMTGCSGGSSSSQPSGPAPTQPPVANAGGPYTGTVGTPVTFSGSASTDPQGQTLTYQWDFGDGVKGTVVSPTHTYPQVAGVTSSVYTVSLIVTDTSGLNSQASTKATIQGVPLLTDAALTGVVTTGSKPIVGAHVYMFAANNAGYGQTSVNLLSLTETGTSDSLGAYVQTDSFGRFTMTGTYTCTAGQQLYLYSLGGNSGAGANASAALLAVIGSCPSSSGPAIAVTVNEVSTVAAAYAMAPFATDAIHVSSSGTPLALVGIANAFANAANLATLSTGVALATTPAGNGAVPRTEINSLADALEPCVDRGINPAVDSCVLLFTNALSGGFTGTVPAETATAAINIAHNPGVNVTSVFNLPGASPAYTPALGAAPNDFTVAITYSGGGLNGPRGVAIDGAGNAWVTNGAGNSVTKLSSAGAVLSGTTGYTTGGLNSPYGIAFDGTGNAWIANSGNNSVSEFSSSGAVLSGSGGFNVGGLNGPRGIAIDGAGNVWVANFGGNSVTKLSSAGAAASGSPYTAGLNQPYGIAIDGSGNAWIANFGTNSVAKLNSIGVAAGGSPFTGGALASPLGVAADSAGNVWLANTTGASVTKLSQAGAVLSGTTGYAAGGIGSPYGIAIDGSGNTWVANQTPYNLTELSSTGSLLSGSGYYASSGLNSPTAVAIDGSGDAWVANNTGSSVSEFIGVAPPVITPIAAGLPASFTADGTSKLGTQP